MQSISSVMINLGTDNGQAREGEDVENAMNKWQVQSTRIDWFSANEYHTVSNFELIRRHSINRPSARRMNERWQSTDISHRSSDISQWSMDRMRKMRQLLSSKWPIVIIDTLFTMKDARELPSIHWQSNMSIAFFICVSSVSVEHELDRESAECPMTISSRLQMISSYPIRGSKIEYWRNRQHMNSLRIEPKPCFTFPFSSRFSSSSHRRWRWPCRSYTRDILSFSSASFWLLGN